MMPSILQSLPVNLMAFAALMTVIFLLGRHQVWGTLRIFLRGAMVLGVILLIAHFVSEGITPSGDRLIELLRNWLELR